MGRTIATDFPQQVEELESEQEDEFIDSAPEEHIQLICAGCLGAFDSEEQFMSHICTGQYIDSAPSSPSELIPLVCAGCMSSFDSEAQFAAHVCGEDNADYYGQSQGTSGQSFVDQQQMVTAQSDTDCSSVHTEQIMTSADTALANSLMTFTEIVQVVTETNELATKMSGGEESHGVPDCSSSSVPTVGLNYEGYANATTAAQHSGNTIYQEQLACACAAEISGNKDEQCVPEHLVDEENTLVKSSAKEMHSILQQNKIHLEISSEEQQQASQQFVDFVNIEITLITDK